MGRAGEEIVRRLLSRHVYEMLALGVPAGEACERGVALHPEDVGIGLLAVDARGLGIASNRPLAAAMASEE